ncbi:hypothetical protein C0Q16_27490, partial [Klebsiella pneumoniae]
APQAYQSEPAPYQQPTYDPYAGQPAPQTYQQPAYDPHAGQPAPQPYQPEPAAYQPQSLRPISSQLTIRMPASPRRSRISRSQRRISRKARQFPHRSQSPRSCRRK